jgi:SAM-dependent methyltransferase
MADDSSHRSYDPDFFAVLFEVEDEHFWFYSRNQIIAARVERLAAEFSGRFRLLEVGCGTGNVLRVLAEGFPKATVVGMDLFAEGLQYARRRTSAALVQGDMHRPPFADQFEIIGLFDVLEHLPDDRQVLRDLGAMLQDGGVLLITVPAHTRLWSYFDEAAHHCRRYEPDELKRKLIEAGYEIDYISQFMMSIFPMVWIGREISALANRMLGRGGSSVEQMATQELRPNPLVNRALTWLLSLETRRLARGHTLPLGTSLLAVARKPR